MPRHEPCVPASVEKGRKVMLLEGLGMYLRSTYSFFWRGGAISISRGWWEGWGAINSFEAIVGLVRVSRVLGRR